MPAGAFKRIKVFLNKLKLRYRKDRDTTRDQRIPRPVPPPEWPSALLAPETQRCFRPQKPLPKLPSTPSIAATQSSIRFTKPLPELPTGQLTLAEEPPALSTTASFSTITTASSSAATTTTATTVEVDKEAASVLSSTSPSPGTGFTDDESVQQTIRPNLPDSQSNSSHISSPASWSEFVDADLVADLGPRERARQEALFEIVFSEESYLSELARIKEAFVNPLLHPFSSTSASPQSSTHRTSTYLREFGGHDGSFRTRSSGYWEHTSIASRSFASLVADQSTTLTPKTTELYHDLDDTSVFCEASKNSFPNPTPASFVCVTPPCHLPEDLRICLEVIENDLLEGHARFSEALRTRYEEQFPLVQSLGDVLHHSSRVLTGYIKYADHLQRAVEQVDDAVYYAKSKEREPMEDQVGHRLSEVGAYIRRLEKNATENGEAGLIVSLSKPFQRLFRYRLMFQNLLSYTYPSSSSYESALKMITEVEKIVWSIEDGRNQRDERDITRDVIGRIDGLSTIRKFAVPKPSRVLIEERMVTNTARPGSRVPRSVVGGEGDLWFVVFNDVVLTCQRTGTTMLPRWGAYQPKQRNFYRFFRIETWDVDDFREHVTLADEVTRPPASVRTMWGVDHNKDEEVRESDRKSRLSSSTWGTDKLTFKKPVTSRERQAVPPRNGVRRGATSGITTYSGESTANAKFGTRLVSSAGQTVAPRRSSPRRVGRNKSATKFPYSLKDPGVGLYRHSLTEDTIPSAKSTATPLRPSPRRIGGMGSNNSTTSLPSLPEDSAVGTYRHSFTRDEAILSSKAVVVPSRPSPRHIYAINNSTTRSPSLSEGTSIGLLSQSSTRENVTLPPNPLPRLSPRRNRGTGKHASPNPSPPQKDPDVGSQNLSKDDPIPPIRVPPRFGSHLLSAEPLIAPSLGEYREGGSPQIHWTQGLPSLNMEEDFMDWEEVEFHIESTARPTTPEPQQEQPEVEEGYEDTWRMSIQSDDIPIPGSFFRKHYVA